MLTAKKEDKMTEGKHREPLQIKIAEGHESFGIKVHGDDAGYDLYSEEDTVVEARGFKKVETGLYMMIPSDYFGKIYPRSGLAMKHGIDVGAGVIDPGYRHTIGVVLFNHSKKNFVIQKGDRIAQIVFHCRHDAVFTRITKGELQETTRKGGFGSTGK